MGEFKVLHSHLSTMQENQRLNDLEIHAVSKTIYSPPNTLKLKLHTKINRTDDIVIHQRSSDGW
jgi:hypothetical protein